MDSSNPISTCPFCDLQVLSSELELHADTHFEDNNIIDNNNISDNNLKTQHNPKLKNLVFTQLKATFHSTQPHPLIQMLKTSLKTEPQNTVTLLSGHVDHYQCVETEDLGWGCGWRNIQMLSSHLVEVDCTPTVRGNLFGGCGFVPDIGAMQRWLEVSWETGFDVDGGEQFGMRVFGTSEWIGATECAAVLRLFGVRARVADFSPTELVKFVEGVDGVEKGVRKGKGKFEGPMDRFVCKRGRDSFEGGCSDSKGGSSGRNGDRVERKSKGCEVLMEWVLNYFSDGKVISCSDQARVVDTGKPPLYFQHDGHSRTIVGIQVKHQPKGLPEYNLLVFDPGHKTADLERSLRRNVGWQRFFKRGVHTLKKPQYQICYVDPGIASGSELEQLKTINAVLFEI